MDPASDWLENLRLGVSEYIVPIIEPDNQERQDALISDHNMRIWAACFTDSSVSDEASYETLESYGDKIANKNVVKKCLRQFPDIRPDEINSLVSYYAANAIQGRLMKNYTITVDNGEIALVDAFLRKAPSSTGIVITKAIYADLYEAILGAIEAAGDEIVDGLGLIYSTRWFEHIFNRTYPELDRKHGRGQASNVLKNLFSRFDFYTEAKGLENGGIDFSKMTTKVGKTTQSKIKYTATFTQALINFLKGLDDSDFPRSYKRSLPSKDRVIAEAVASDNKKAREKVSDNVLDYLEEKFGIDEEWATNLKRKLDMQAVEQDREVSEQYKRVLRYTTVQGYTTIFFKTLSKHTKEGNRQGIQIVGRDSQGRTKVFFTHVYEEGDKYKVRKDAIRDFARSLER